MSEPQPTGPGYEEYYLRTNPPTEANYRRKAAGYERRLGRLLNQVKPRSVLDLGCATGMLTKYLVEKGCDAVGVDINPKLVEIARRNVQAEFHVADAAEFAKTCDQKFDLVLLLDILEHIPRDEVVDLLATVRNLISEDGFVLVRTPNMNAIHVAGMFYVDWEHLTPFTERSLLHVAKLAGYSRIDFVPQFAMQNFKGKIKALINHCLVRALVWLRGGHKVRVTYRNLLAKLYR